MTVHHLVDDFPQRDVVHTLEQLLVGAQHGQVVGLAFGAMLRHRRYITAASGECHRDPTYTRGMLKALDDEMAALVQHCACNSTR